MFKTRTITCEQCRQPYETIRANTKVCARCGMLRDLLFVGERIYKCWVCDGDFAPLDTHDKACAEDCYQAAKHGETECAFCHNTRARVRSGIDVCHVCARDPQLRAQVIKALRKGQRAAMAAT